MFSFGETLIGTAKPIVVIAINKPGVKAFVEIVGNMDSREPFLCYTVNYNFLVFVQREMRYLKTNVQMLNQCKS